MKSCNQCGKCCINYSQGGLTATPEEIAYWQQHQPEIAKYVNAEQIWFDPNSGEQLTRCPWLQSKYSSPSDRTMYSCRIYQYRPADCRHYPVNLAQMKQDQCEMLEESDLQRPKMAQRKLDKLMAESRAWSIEWLD